MAEVSLLVKSVDNVADGGDSGSKGLGGCGVKVCREVRRSLESGLDSAREPGERCLVGIMKSKNSVQDRSSDEDPSLELWPTMTPGRPSAQ